MLFSGVLKRQQLLGLCFEFFDAALPGRGNGLQNRSGQALQTEALQRKRKTNNAFRRGGGNRRERSFVGKSVRAELLDPRIPNDGIGKCSGKARQVDEYCAALLGGLDV